MRDGWVETPIGDVAQVLSGFAFKSELFNKSEGMPLIRIRDLPKRDSTEALYSGSYEDRYVVKKGDLLIGMDGEFHCYEWNGPNALLNQRVCRIQDFKIDRVVPRYIYFAVNQYLDRIEQSTGYTTVKHISAKQVLGIKIPLPPLPEQKRIVDLISSVDSYIEALQKQLESAKRSRNAVLHELLTAGGEGWVETTLDGIAEYINGYPFKPSDLGDVGLPVIRIKQLLDPNEPVDRTETGTPDRCLLRDGDIVFSWSGTLAVRIWNRGPAKLNQHLFRVVEKEGVYKGIIPLILDHAIEELEEKSHGTTMKHITKQTLLPHKVLLPPPPEQKRIVEIIKTIDEVISQTELTTSKAQNLRSGLLSDLLSGEHEIPTSYDKFIGAAE